jgi:hypothetical protein
MVVPDKEEIFERKYNNDLWYIKCSIVVNYVIEYIFP